MDRLYILSKSAICQDGIHTQFYAHLLTTFALEIMPGLPKQINK